MPSNNLSNSLSSHEPFSKLDRWSLNFDGSNDRLDAGDITVFDGLSDMSISVWIKVSDSASGTNPIITKGSYNTDGASFHLNYNPGSGSGRLNFSVERDSDQSDGEGMFAYYNSVGSLLDGKWAHIVISYSNTSDALVLYINGSAETINSTSGTFINIPNSSSTFQIANGFLGNISDVAVYNSALSASNVTSIYDGGDSYRHDTGVANANLIGWWRMGDGAENGAGTTIYDASTNSNNCTLTNMDATSDYEEDSP